MIRIEWKWSDQAIASAMPCMLRANMNIRYLGKTEFVVVAPLVFKRR